MVAAAALMAASSLGQVATAATTNTWMGGTSGNWSGVGNWTTPNAGSVPVSGDLLSFTGSTFHDSTSNDIAGLTLNGISFASGSDAYTLGGPQAITLGAPLDPGTGNGSTTGGSITNASTNLQSLSLALTIAAGYHAISTSSSGGLAFSGAVTRSSNAIVQFTIGGGAINFTGSGLTTSNGILGGWATIGLGTNLGDWATLDGSGNVVAYSSYTTKGGGSNMGLSNSGGNAANNIKINSRSSTANTLNSTTAGTYDINTLMWNIGNSNPSGDQTLNISSNQVLRLGLNGAIMNVHANGRALNIGNNGGGSITAGGPNANTGGEISLYAVPFNNGNQRLVINAPINDNGSGVVSVNTLGDVILKQNGNFSGGVNAVIGRVQANTTGAFGTGTVTVYPGGEAFPWNSGNAGTYTNNFVLNGFGSTQDTMAIRGQTGTTLSGTITLSTTSIITSNGNSFTLSGPMNGNGGLIVSGGFGDGSLHLDQSSPLTFAGDTTIDAVGIGNNTNHSITIYVDNSTHNNIMPSGPGTGNLILKGASANFAQFDIGGSTQTINGLISAGTATNTLVTSNPGGGTLILGANNASATFAGVIGTSGGNGTTNINITKTGSGIQTLSGTSNYTGNTNVNAGVLSVTGSLTGGSAVAVGGGTLAGTGNMNGSVTVNSGAIDPGAIGHSSVGTLMMSNGLTVNGGSLNFDLGTTSDQLAVTGGAVSFASSSTLAPTGGTAGSSYTVITGSMTGSALPTLVQPTGATRIGYTYDPTSYDGSNGASSIIIDVVGQTANLTWNNTGLSGDGKTWDANNNRNWTSTATAGDPNQFYQGDNVTFNDSNNGHYGVTLSGSLSPSSMTVNTSGAYTFAGTGSISGASTLAMSGTGSLTINTSNSFSGGTTISSGAINANAANALGAGNITLNGGALNINHAAALGIGTLIINGGTIDNTSSAAITLSTNNAQTWNADVAFAGTNSLNLGTGNVAMTGNRAVTVAANSLTVGGAIGDGGNNYGLTKAGSGTLVLGAVNTYTGDTTVTGGALNLAAGGSAGTVNGTLTINAGTTVTLSAGNALGFTVGTKVNTININGGLLDATPASDQGWGVAYVLTGGTMQTNGGTASSSTSSKFAFGGPAGSNTSVTTLASATTSTIKGRIDLRNDNGDNTSNPVMFNVADGAAAVDLLVSANITRHDTTANQSAAGIVKTGAGVMSLSGSNAYTGLTSINAGTLKLASSGALGGGGNITFGGGTLQYSAGNAVDYSGKIINSTGAAISIDTNGQNVAYGTAMANSNTAGLTKLGSGMLSLGGNQAYSGTTTISGGTLAVNGSIGTNVTVNSGAALGGSGSVNGAVTVNTGGILSGGATGTLSITGGIAIGSQLTDLAIVNVARANNVPSFSVVGGLSANTDLNGITVNVGGTAPTVGVYPLIAYDTLGGNNGFAAFHLGTLPPRITATLSNSGSSIDLNVLTFDFPIWTGALSSEWSTGILANPKNWVLNSNAATVTDYIEGDTVRFDDTATGTTTVDVSVANVTPVSVTFANSTKNYTITGSKSITGTATLTKSGSGLLTINNTNTYTGGTTLSAGTLNLGVAGAIGSSALTINGGTIDNTSSASLSLPNNTQTWAGDFTYAGATQSLNMGTGTVTLSASNVNVNVTGNSLTVGGVISGATNSISKSGSGTLVLTAQNTFGGGLTVNAGTVQVNANGSGKTSLGSGNTTVNAGATLIGGAADSFGFNNGVSPASIFINGGTVTDLPNSAYRITLRDISFTGGTLTSALGAAGDSNGHYSLFAGTVETNAASTTAVISAGIVSMQNGTTTFTVAPGTVSTGPTRGVDLAVSSILTNFGGTAGVLVKNGGGVLSLSGVNTYTGNTTVNAGTLAIASTGSIVSSNVTVASGTTFNAGGDSNAGLSTTAALNSGGTTTIRANPLNNLTPSAVTLSSVTVNAGTTSLLNAADHRNRTVLVTGGLTIGGATGAWTGTLDLGSNDAIVHNGVVADLIDQLHSGLRSGSSGNWTGTGIASSDAAADSRHILAVGMIRNDQVVGGNDVTVKDSFDSIGALVTTDVLLKETFFGDANLDGSVNAADYSLIDNGYQMGQTGWLNGDFNYDGAVNAADYSLIDTSFAFESVVGSPGAVAPLAVAMAATDSGTSAVPEPANPALLAAAGGLLAIRRRRVRKGKVERTKD